MNPPVRTSVSVVLAIVFLIALPYLFFFFQPSVWFAISSCASRNAPIDASPPASSTSSADPGPEVPSSSDVNSSPEVQARSAVSPSAEVRARSAVAPSPEIQANASAALSSEVPSSSEDEPGLESMLRRAATANKTVIITTLNQAWATPGTMVDLFLESFRRGEDTKPLLKHLVMVALDRRSLQRCQELHEHCFMLRTPGVDFSGSKGFMSRDFLKMMWRRMRLLRRVLELGYNFVFTDADILWFRNPFDHFADNVDFQISCDKNRGSVWSTLNRPNCGYQYALSNERTISMYQHWCRGGEENPNIDEQSLLKKMLYRHAFDSYKVKIQFLPTEQFSGFCEKSKNMSRVVTMHANCCTGLANKVQDLRTALSAWEASKSLSIATNTTRRRDLWHVPNACRHSLWPSPPPRKP